MLSWVGLGLFPLIGLLMLGAGLPAFVALIGAAGLGGLVAIANGAGAPLTALPGRIVNLLEGDLFQALPLFVFVGALINRLPLAGILFGVVRAGAGSVPGVNPAAASRLSALTLGALLAPMNGSVGASVAMLSRGVQPLLAREGMEPATRTALVAAAATIGVVIPPSLVLIFLGDAMMAAHTVAVNATGQNTQIINTQDVFRASFGPALMLLVLWVGVSLIAGRGEAARSPDATGWPQRLVAAAAIAAIVALLGGVATGAFYAVEAAALGGCALIVAGLVSRTLSLAMLSDVLRQVLALSGALFALLVAATTFTLVLRVLGTDRLLAAGLAALPGGPGVAMLVVLLIVGVSAFVLDAFEIVFVIVPIVMPGLLMKTPDAAWAAALILLMLQASFLLPPLGYALMMARGAAGQPVSSRQLAHALAPYLGAQVLVIGLTFLVPGIAHWFDPAPPPPPTIRQLSPEERAKQFDLAPPPLPAPEFK